MSDDPWGLAEYARGKENPLIARIGAGVGEEARRGIFGLGHNIQTLIGPMYGEGQVGSPEFVGAATNLAGMPGGAPEGALGTGWSIRASMYLKKIAKSLPEAAKAVEGLLPFEHMSDDPMAAAGALATIRGTPDAPQVWNEANRLHSLDMKVANWRANSRVFGGARLGKPVENSGVLGDLEWGEMPTGLPPFQANDLVRGPKKSIQDQMVHTDWLYDLAKGHVDNNVVKGPGAVETPALGAGMGTTGSPPSWSSGAQRMLDFLGYTHGQFGKDQEAVDFLDRAEKLGPQAVKGLKGLSPYEGKLRDLLLRAEEEGGQ